MSIAERYFYTWSITYRIYHGQNCRSQIQLRTRTAIAVEKRENVTFGDRCVVWTEGNHSQNCSGQGRRRSADRYSSFPLSVIVTMLHNVYDTEEKRLDFFHLRQCSKWPKSLCPSLIMRQPSVSCTLVNLYFFTCT